MNPIASFYLGAKHWQLFLLSVALTLVQVFALLSDATLLGNPAITKTICGALDMLFLLGWMWSAGTFLNSLLRRDAARARCYAVLHFADRAVRSGADRGCCGRAERVTVAAAVDAAGDGGYVRVFILGYRVRGGRSAARGEAANRGIRRHGVEFLCGLVFRDRNLVDPAADQPAVRRGAGQIRWAAGRFLNFGVAQAFVPVWRFPWRFERNQMGGNLRPSFVCALSCDS